ncbi:MAG: LysM peptidoglycan-binding domain-containing protein [Porticoccaceae bacterium]
MKIPGTGLDHPIGSLATTYTVKSGDSLWKIARQHKVKITDITRWNNLSTRTPLQQGQILKLNPTPATPHMAGTKKVRYKVRRGDSLSRIASKFDLKINQIINWNKLNPGSYLQPGQRLTLFVDIRNI